MRIIAVSSRETCCRLHFLSSLFSILMISIAVDTISTTRSLTDGNTLVSSGGAFELGFFSPDNSKYRYLGIWYNQVSTPTIAWVANRDTPLIDTSGSLNLTNQGILVLINSSNTIIWSSNSSKSTQNPIAILLETGNFVVKDANNYLWQSFDYPSDTLLPGMKLGLDLITGLNRFLWSWRSNNDPSQGAFIFRLDPNGFPQLILTNGSIEQFRSGPWNGKAFSGAPGLKPNPIYTYDFIFDQKEIYYGFALINSSVYSRLQLSPNGVLQRFTWNYRTQGWVPYLNAPADNCDTYALCHSYGSCDIGESPVCGCLDKFVPKDPNDWDRADWSNGCVRRTELDCQNGDGFVKYSGFKVPDTHNSWFNRTMNLEECGKMCLMSCSCMAYANLDIREGGSGCLLWFDELIDMRVLSENGEDIYIRMASSELGKNSSSGPGVSFNEKRQKIYRIVFPLLVGMLLVSLSMALYVWKRKKDKRKERKQQELLMKEGTIVQSYAHCSNERHKEDVGLPLFDLATIASATDNFSFNNKLGEGGFGPVYKGKLEEGQLIAVKRLSKNSLQGVDELKNEVICIAKLQHRNLVRLLGCCIEAEEKMLVYEYMPNNSLDSFIFDKTRRTLLDWAKRFNIINGIARGLLYLHQDSRLRVIHRDLKAANVLLDIDMNPKISDFGMARSFGGNETEASTQRVVGTYGYMSPEYAVDGIFSVKSDVFSFGVLVLEIVSGKKNRGFFHADHHHNLLGHAWMLHKEGRSLELIDADLRESCYVFEVLRSIHVALLCVQQCPEDRPNMSNVVLLLGSEGELGWPKEPGFFTERNVFLETQYSSSNYKEVSANEMSITLLDAR